MIRAEQSRTAPEPTLRPTPEGGAGAADTGLSPTPADLLWARFVLDRIAALASPCPAWPTSSAAENSDESRDHSVPGGLHRGRDGGCPDPAQAGQRHCQVAGDLQRAGVGHRTEVGGGDAVLGAQGAHRVGVSRRK